MPDERYELAVDEARRALDRQADDVGSVRSRSAALVSVGALAAAFLGGLAVRGDGQPTSTRGILGAFAFVIVLVMALLVLWPRKFVFTHGSKVIVSWIVEHNADVDRMRRNLALRMWEHYATNDRHLRQFTWFYRASLTFLAVEIILLLIDLRR